MDKQSKNQKETDNRENCKKFRPAQYYTHTQEIIDNGPYIIMTLLGAGLFLLGFNLSFWGWFAAIFYVFYSIAGIFWIIVFVCPYCFFLRNPILSLRLWSNRGQVIAGQRWYPVYGKI